MNSKKAINAGEMTITFSPELEQMLGRLMQKKKNSHTKGSCSYHGSGLCRT